MNGNWLRNRLRFRWNDRFSIRWKQATPELRKILVSGGRIFGVGAFSFCMLPYAFFVGATVSQDVSKEEFGFGTFKKAYLEDPSFLWANGAFASGVGAVTYFVSQRFLFNNWERILTELLNTPRAVLYDFSILIPTKSFVASIIALYIALWPAIHVSSWMSVYDLYYGTSEKAIRHRERIEKMEIEKVRVHKKEQDDKKDHLDVEIFGIEQKILHIYVDEFEDYFRENGGKNVETIYELWKREKSEEGYALRIIDLYQDDPNKIVEHLLLKRERFIALKQIVDDFVAAHTELQKEELARVRKVSNAAFSAKYSLENPIREARRVIDRSTIKDANYSIEEIKENEELMTEMALKQAILEYERGQVQKLQTGFYNDIQAWEKYYSYDFLWHFTFDHAGKNLLMGVGYMFAYVPFFTICGSPVLFLGMIFAQIPSRIFLRKLKSYSGQYLIAISHSVPK